MFEGSILCPVCGGKVTVRFHDAVNTCLYCSSPILGPSQERNCVNHPDHLADGICHVCGDLVCEECLQKRAGTYGGKLFTVVNCTKEECIKESEWAPLINPRYQELANMDWADQLDNSILRVCGLGAVLMMIFELIFIISMLGIQYFTPWGTATPSNIPYIFFRGDMVIFLSLVGNLVSALLLQTALQVYVHERQLGAGIMLLVFLVLEVFWLLYRGWFFNLLSYPDRWYPTFLLGSFLMATLLVFVGSLMAIRNGWKKRNQLIEARKTLGLVEA